MGAWGYSTLETDEGLEIIDRWDSLVDLGYENNAIIDSLLKHWGDSIKYGDSITNNEIIATAQLCTDKKIDLPEKLKKVTCDAINRELEPSELERWGNAQKREGYLSALLEDIGGRREPPKKHRFFQSSVLDFKTTNDARKQLKKAVKKMRESKVPLSYSKAGFPSFLSTLDRFVNHKLSEKDASLFIEARKQRLMMIASYLSLHLKMSDEELERLFSSIDKNE